MALYFLPAVYFCRWQASFRVICSIVVLLLFSVFIYWVFTVGALAGFGAYRDKPNTLVSYGAEMGLAGLMLGALSLLASILNGARNKLDTSRSPLVKMTAG
jgi:hypothetical protein